ncbi:MAG: DegV family protein [Candidatus Nealsonbacteria bacterium]
MQYLSQNDLKKMILLSYERINKEKEAINKINVFPVPDQDTGNNVEKTLSGIKKTIEDSDFDTLSDFTEAILDGALTAAQGNAGVIYTGFLAGFLPELTERIDVNNLALAFEKGAKRAKESIQNPQQGTILDVIDAAASVFKKASDKEDDIISVFEKAVKNADKALIETKEKMEILKKANVVDAGGLAFLIILESHLEALKSRGEEARPQEKPSEKVKRFIQIISNRYEVVALIADPVLEIKKIKERLEKLGNSIDIVQVKNRVKIHIHSDYPDEVRSVLKKIGEIKSLRIEDVTKEIVGEESIRAVSVGLVTESSSMLLSKIIERYQIELIDCEKKLSEEKISNQNIFQRLRKRKIKIPGLTYRHYLSTFEKQLKKFSSVLCIVSSSKLYNCYDLAMKARLASSNPRKIFVFDSLNTGTGQALVVLKSIELTQEQRSIDDIVKKLKSFVSRMHHYVFSENFKQTTRAGKIKLYLVLQVKNGKVLKTGVILAQNSTEALIKKILKESKKFKKIRVILGYSKSIEAVKKIKDGLKSKTKADISFMNLMPLSVTSVIGSQSIAASWTGILKK